MLLSGIEDKLPSLVNLVHLLLFFKKQGKEQNP